MRYKVVMMDIQQKKNDDGKDEYLLVQQTRNKYKPIPCYKKEYMVIGEDLSFFDAKELRNKNVGSWIVRF